MLIIEKLISIIAPEKCVSCQKIGELFCTVCQNLYLQPRPPVCYMCNKLAKNWRTCKSCQSSSNVYSCIVPYEYDGLFKILIKKYKYQRQRSLVKTLTKLLPNPVDGVDFVTFVPTSSKRLRQRGYDHAKLLGLELSRKYNRPLISPLIRVSNSRQVGKSRKERIEQASLAYECAKKSQGSVLLVDDVVSTGATIEACSGLLKKHGAKRVIVLAVARKI